MHVRRQPKRGRRVQGRLDCRAVSVYSDPDSYPQRIRLRDLEQLAKSPRNSGEDTVQTYYSWRDARAMTFARGLGGAALAILTAWLIPFLKHEYKDVSAGWVVLLPCLLVVLLALLGLASYLRMDQIHSSYVRANVWLQLFR